MPRPVHDKGIFHKMQNDLSIARPHSKKYQDLFDFEGIFQEMPGPIHGGGKFQDMPRTLEPKGGHGGLDACTNIIWNYKETNRNTSWNATINWGSWACSSIANPLVLRADAIHDGHRESLDWNKQMLVSSIETSWTMSAFFHLTSYCIVSKDTLWITICLLTKSNSVIFYTPKPRTYN